VWYYKYVLVGLALEPTQVKSPKLEAGTSIDVSFEAFFD